MTDNVVKIKKNENILRLDIITESGEKTGECLEFDLSDIELPLKYQDLLEKDKKNREWIRNQILIIDKRQDVRGDKLLTRNEEDKIKAIQEFFKKETEIYNMFLGKDGVQKLLNGQSINWDTLLIIDDIIEKQITPHLEKHMLNITEMIKSKYKRPTKNEDEIEIVE